MANDSQATGVISDRMQKASMVAGLLRPLRLTACTLPLEQYNKSVEEMKAKLTEGGLAPFIPEDFHTLSPGEYQNLIQTMCGGTQWQDSPEVKQKTLVKKVLVGTGVACVAALGLMWWHFRE